MQARTPASPEPPPPPPEHPAPREQVHELRDRAKAAKLRHKAAKACLKATRSQEKPKVLFERAAYFEEQADAYDGIVRAKTQPDIEL